MSMYTLLEEDILEIVEQSLSEYPTTPVIYANENGTEPQQSYCAIGKLFTRQLQTAENSFLDEDSVSQMSVGYEVSCTISFIGEQGGNLAFSSHARMGNTTLNREFSQARNLSLRNKSNVVPIPYFRATKYVDVFSYDVSFHFIWGVTEEIQPILQVIIENSDYSETITIPETI